MKGPAVVNSEEIMNRQNTKKTINYDDMKEQNQTPKRKTNNQLRQKLARG